MDAFVSHAGILYPHPSGIPVASPHYDTLTLRAPWLHSVPAAWLTQPPDSQAESLFDTAVHSERYLLLTEGMGQREQVRDDADRTCVAQGRKSFCGSAVEFLDSTALDNRPTLPILPTDR